MGALQKFMYRQGADKQHLRVVIIPGVCAASLEDQTCTHLPRWIETICHTPKTISVYIYQHTVRLDTPQYWDLFCAEGAGLLRAMLNLHESHDDSSQESSLVLIGHRLGAFILKNAIILAHRTAYRAQEKDFFQRLETLVMMGDPDLHEGNRQEWTQLVRESLRTKKKLPQEMCCEPALTCLKAISDAFERVTIESRFFQVQGTAGSAKGGLLKEFWRKRSHCGCIRHANISVRMWTTADEEEPVVVPEADDHNCIFQPDSKFHRLLFLIASNDFEMQMSVASANVDNNILTLEAAPLVTSEECIPDCSDFLKAETIREQDSVDPSTEDSRDIFKTSIIDPNIGSQTQQTVFSSINDLGQDHAHGLEHESVADERKAITGLETSSTLISSGAVADAPKPKTAFELSRTREVSNTPPQIKSSREKAVSTQSISSNGNLTQSISTEFSVTGTKSFSKDENAEQKASSIGPEDNANTQEQSAKKKKKKKGKRVVETEKSREGNNDNGDDRDDSSSGHGAGNTDSDATNHDATDNCDTSRSGSRSQKDDQASSDEGNSQSSNKKSTEIDDNDKRKDDKDDNDGDDDDNNDGDEEDDDDNDDNDDNDDDDDNDDEDDDDDDDGSNDSHHHHGVGALGADGSLAAQPPKSKPDDSVESSSTSVSSGQCLRCNTKTHSCPSRHRRLPLSLQVPQRCSDFIGREDILNDLTQKFRSHMYNFDSCHESSRGQKMVWLCGMGGIGKTQIALEYAYRYQARYDYIFWMRASNETSFLQSCDEVSIALHLVQGRKPHSHDESSAALMSWILSSDSSWLMVLDNADDLGLFDTEFLRNSRGNILVTARRRPSVDLLQRDLMDVVDVPPLTAKESAHLMFTRLGFSDQTTIAVLGELLEGHPLALSCVCAYVKHRAVSTTEQQQRLARLTCHFRNSAQQFTKRLSDLALVEELIDFVLNKTSVDPSALTLARVLACLSDRMVSNSILLGILTCAQLELHGAPWTEKQFDESRELLLDLCVCDAGLSEHSLEMHRTIQGAIRRTMGQEILLRSCSTASELLLHQWPSRRKLKNVLFGYWPEFDQIYSHVHSLSETISTLRIKDCFSDQSIPWAFTKLLIQSTWYNSHVRNNLYEDLPLTCLAHRLLALPPKDFTATGAHIVDTNFFRPRRLALIDSRAQSLRIVDTNQTDVEYVALSHCWNGATQSVRLTEATQRRLRAGTALSAMPLLFREACRITASLGMDHLWTDTLCVLQDDPDDLASEIHKMADIYRGASFCITALDDTSYASTAQTERDGTCLDLNPYLIYRHGIKRTSAWTNKIWSLQEILLSPHVITDTSERMYLFARQTQHSLCRPRSWNQTDSPYQIGGRVVAGMPLGTEAEVDTQQRDENLNTPLMVAVANAQCQLVRALLNAGADVNSQGGYYGNALQAAAASAQFSLVRILLDAGADVNAQGGYYGNALQAAVASAHCRLVRILLDAGANVNAQGGYYGNALQAASAIGEEKIVQILLNARAEIKAHGGYYGNAIQAASATGHHKVVQMLLNAGQS